MVSTAPRAAIAVAVLLCATAITAAAYLGLGLKLDSFNVLPIVLFTLLSASQVLALPKAQITGAIAMPALAILAGTLLVYTSDSMPALAAGWILSALPAIWMRDEQGGRSGLPAVALIASIAALLAAILFLQNDGMSKWAFGAFTLAVVFRKGIFPAQSWVPILFEKKPLWLANLTVNSHLGAVLAVRVAIPMLAEESRTFTETISFLALMTAMGSSLAALREDRPRRLMAWVFLSQSAVILAGLESANVEGISGAFAHMIVVALATSALFVVYQGIEARFGANFSAGDYAGLASRTPRLAGFFLIAALALVGLPGTLGFCAEDLLMHGTMFTHPVLGVVLPLTTALNAWNLFRLYSRLFLGKGPRAVPAVDDALPRERWVLAAIALALVVGGLAPQVAIDTRAQAAKTLAGHLTLR